MKTAFPSLNQPVTITLFANIPFDNTYKDHSFISKKFKRKMSVSSPVIYIGSNTSQDRFLYRKNKNGYNIYPHWTLTDTFNFDFKNGLVGSVYLELTNEQTNSNYMKVVCGTDEYYYFITSIIQSNYGTYQLSLELDVLMTYGDEFLESISNYPVFTKRKHCKRTFGSYLFSPDYKSGESIFANIKPSLVEKIEKPTLDIDKLVTKTYEECLNFSDMLWLYVICDIGKTRTGFQSLYYSCKGVSNPFSILCFPLSCNVRFEQSNGHLLKIIHKLDGNSLSKLVTSEHYKGSKVLPYPPFSTMRSDMTITTTANRVVTPTETYYTDHTLEIKGNAYEVFNTTEDTPVFKYAKLDTSPREKDSNITFGDTFEVEDDDFNQFLSSAIIINEQHNPEYDFVGCDIFDFEVSNTTILDDRRQDGKLLFKPFKKYCLTSASGEETEFFPELLCSLSPFDTDGDQKLYLKTITTLYGGDYTAFTYIKPVELRTDFGYSDYKYGKIGLSTTMNYTIPVGTNALDVFRTTQSETFYQSKLASGISSGIAIIGGVGMTIGGIALTATGGASPIGLGMIGGGLTSLASGTASMANTINSTNAKIEDLKNTPNTINVSGSSYAHDIAMNLNGLYPYFITYKSTENIIKCADDYFYTSGYEVGRDCHYNDTFLGYEIEPSLDTKLFTRTIFNYVELQEDITNKIRGNIPLVVKQKLSSIFNKGVTLWTFLGFTSMYGSSVVNESDTYNLDNWLFKHDLDNTEYKGETYAQ